MPGKREDYISWEKAFMGVALISSMRSKDPRTQVGACIVDKENHILSTGYNGAPLGFSDDDMPWNSIGELDNDIMKIKNTFVCHAEANAIDNFAGNKERLVDSTMYVTFFPCQECTKRIIQNKIKKVVYLRMYSDKKSVEASMLMFEKAGVQIKQFDIKDLHDLKREFNRTIDKELTKLEYNNYKKAFSNSEIVEINDTIDEKKPKIKK